MMEEIITLIIHEASTVQAMDIGPALQSVLNDITSLINMKIQDLARLDNMHILDKEKDKIREIILNTRIVPG